ncbi:cation:proton antiporter subunit C [Kaistia terrae]|uniref:Cation:proton antiporter subunit C n=1 Tax=Kaistia terrae TaxID=537017 RepID=A0ABW0PXI5_9HYPH|nr:cation:proton antiporter subunit C [Kaistia terrae]MCX5576809.1 cation:proton antiporter subunit C [Kaistia terrae]
MIAHFSQIATVFLMVAGLYVVIARGNLIKKLIGLSLFQTSVYLLYILPGKVLGGTAPILDAGYSVYANPLPHVLILTAIVVGIATLALGLTLVVRIKEAYGTIEEDEIFAKDGPRAKVDPKVSKASVSPLNKTGRGGKSA